MDRLEKETHDDDPTVDRYLVDTRLRSEGIHWMGSNSDITAG